MKKKVSKRSKQQDQKWIAKAELSNADKRNLARTYNRICRYFFEDLQDEDFSKQFVTRLKNTAKRGAKGAKGVGVLGYVHKVLLGKS